MKAIVVSGTPGTGKTTFAKELAKRSGFLYFDVNGLIDEKSLCAEYDEKRKCKVIDEKRLVNELIKKIDQSKQVLVIDSHMAHLLPKEYVSKCFITTCDLKELERRMKERGYSKEKIRENLDAEIFETCRVEAEHLDQRFAPVSIDTECESLTWESLPTRNFILAFSEVSTRSAVTGPSSMTA